MNKLIGSPLVRISAGLVMLTCSILLMFEFLGLVPNPKIYELKYRKSLVESLAVQLNSDLTANRHDNVSNTLKALVARNDSVLSAAVRKMPNVFIAQFGNHEQTWLLKPTDKSTASQVQVSIYNQGKPWGTIEVSFNELNAVATPFYVLILFVALSGFICYLLFLKRAMLELDPGSVVPERVRNALNTLSDGLLILDNKQQIVFSNEPFLHKSALSIESVIGKKASDLDWQFQSKDAVLPWIPIINGKPASSGADLKLRSKSGKYVSYKVNVSPIGATGKAVRGALVTFNDITELESKNNELGRLLEKLKLGQKEIAAQNKELKYLATRDPLTGCLNRRSFFEGLRVLINEAKNQNNSLSCIMLDIDHFKSVNDRFGHAVGDRVIKMVASALKEISRSNDLVGRYGGEEFCVVLPHTTAESAAQVAERMRLSMMKTQISGPDGEFSITSSFGVALWTNNLDNAEAFVSQADEALYVAKESGRNRVEIWAGNDEKSDIVQSSGPLVEQTESKAQIISLTGSGIEPDEKTVSAINVEGGPNGNIYPLVIEDVNDMLSDIDLEPCRNDAELDAAPETFGLPCREVMLDRITQAVYRAKRTKSKFALLVLDLEKARQISNSMGHAASEKFISEMGNKISQLFRSTDCVSILDIAENSFSLSQISSYEFAILLDDFSEDEFVVNILNRIFMVLESSTIVEGIELYLDSSIGVSIYPNDGHDPDELISNASTAMSEAKLKLGRNNFRFYSADINMQANQQLKTENDLHKAVECDEFVVYYQPKIDLITGNLCGMEALVRWQHPELGMIAPDKFIPLAESNGIIEAITSKVISIVCGQLVAWREAGLPIVPVAINLSPVQFRNKMLASQIISMVARSGLLPENIELEITENVAVDNLGATVDLIQEFNDAGFSVSLDDFGTGYCSYNYLKHFPVDKIKIDRSIISGFSDNTFDAAIVHSIITLADHLGLMVVAEGVETDEQLKFLRDLNCHQVQGYLISRPVPYEEITKFLLDPSVIKRKVLASLGGDFNASTQLGYPTKAELTGILNNVNY